MSFKKQILAVAAVTALTAATAVPAMALENEFHGMYKFMGYVTNAETGGTTFNLNKDAKDTLFAEQRARLMYIAKANDNLKLVTHFELDARFGGQTTGNPGKYPVGDAGGLDADRITLETKNIYLDFSVPGSCPANFKVGIQPWSDAYQGIFAAMDATGVFASAKAGAFTPSLGWFRLADNNYAPKAGAVPELMPGKQGVDLFVADGKFAVSKDLNVGVSYYNVQNDQKTGVTTVPMTAGYELLHMIGANASAKVGPAALNAFFAYQFGDFTGTTGTRNISAMAASGMAKVAAGPGKVNASILYLSGDKASGTGDFKAFRQLDTSGAVSYFNPSNMWLLIRNGAMINSSTAIGGVDLTKGDRGLLGFFAGYEAAAGKLFGSANIGYALVDEKRSASDSGIGTELNATVGYKVFDNLTASATAAYLVLGDFSKKALTAPAGDINNRAIAGLRVNDADNPYLVNVQLSYTF